MRGKAFGAIGGGKKRMSRRVAYALPAAVAASLIATGCGSAGKSPKPKAPVSTSVSKPAVTSSQAVPRTTTSSAAPKALTSVPGGGSGGSPSTGDKAPSGGGIERGGLGGGSNGGGSDSGGS